MNKAQQRFESGLKKILKTPATEVQRRIAAAKTAKSLLQEKDEQSKIAIEPKG
jgi:protein subunit release factor A